MNVSTIKLVCWLSSLASLGGLARFAHQWFEHAEERRSPIDGSATFPVSDEDRGLVAVGLDGAGPMTAGQVRAEASRRYVTRLLEEHEERATAVPELVEYDELLRTFRQMTWTGERPPQEVEDAAGLPPLPRPRRIDEILAIVMLRYDPVDPGGCVAEVTYRDEGRGGSLRVGQALDEPYGYAVVHSIQAESIRIAFRDPERESEVLGIGGQEGLIFADAAGGVRLPSRVPVPTGSRDRPGSTTRTVEVANNVFALGDGDLQLLADDHQRILGEEVSTATHWKDGRRAGVEIRSVEADSIVTRHGLQEGDVLISINGQAVHSEAEVVSYVQDNQGKFQAWELAVLRFGEKVILMYTSPGD